MVHSIMQSSKSSQNRRYNSRALFSTYFSWWSDLQICYIHTSPKLRKTNGRIKYSANPSQKYENRKELQRKCCNKKMNQSLLIQKHGVKKTNLDGMIEEDAVHRFSYRIHAAERERKVRETSANSCTRKSLLRKRKEKKIINNKFRVYLLSTGRTFLQILRFYNGSQRPMLLAGYPQKKKTWKW